MAGPPQMTTLVRKPQHTTTWRNRHAKWLQPQCSYKTTSTTTDDANSGVLPDDELDFKVKRSNRHVLSESGGG